MTDIPDLAGLAGARVFSDPVAAPAKNFVVDETYWGYIVRSTEPAPMALVLAQGLSWLLGIGFLVATLGLWLMPAALFNGDILTMKFGASSFMAIFAGFLLWFASRGCNAEVQIDTARGEVREVVRNRAGRMTQTSSYGFDAIGGVFMDRTNSFGKLKPGHACLVLRYRNTAQILPVIIGHETVLAPLRDRIGHDLMVRPKHPLRVDFEAQLVAAGAA